MYTLEKHFTKDGYSVYLEMHWSSWWWEMQVCYLHGQHYNQILYECWLWYIRVPYLLEQLLYQFSSVLMRHASPPLVKWLHILSMRQLEICQNKFAEHTDEMLMFLLLIFQSWSHLEMSPTSLYSSRLRGSYIIKAWKWCWMIWIN